MMEASQQDLERYFGIFKRAQVGMYRSNVRTGRVSDANLCMARMAGFETVEDFCKGWTGPDCWVDPELRAKAVEELHARGSVDCFECQFYRKDRSTFWARVWAKLLEDRTTLIGVVVDTTVQRQAMEELKYQKAITDSIVENVPAGILLLDRSFVIRKCNRAFAGFLEKYAPGRSVDIAGKSLFDVIKSRHDQMLGALEKILAGGRTQTFNRFRLTTVKDGKQLDTCWQVSVAPAYDAAGKIDGLLILCRDMTVEHGAQEAQRQTDRWLRLILQHSLDGINICTFDPDTIERKLVLCNDSYVRMSGYAREQLMSCDNLERLVTNLYDRPDQDMEIYRCLVEGRPCKGRASWKRPDGGRNEYEWTALPIRMGPSIYIFGIDRDVTAQRLAREAQEQTDQWLRLILQHSSDGINVCSYDPENRARRLVVCNDRYVEMSGRTRQELEAAPNLSELLIPLTPEHERQRRHGMIMKGGVPYCGRSSWKRPDGKENYVEWSAASFHLGGKIYTIGVDRDVTELESDRKALRESEHRYRTLVQMSPDAISMLDMQGRMLMSNDAGLRVFGFDSVEQANAMKPIAFDFIVPEQRHLLAERLEELMARGTARASFTLQRKDGSTFPAELNVSLLLDDLGEPSGMIVITRDTSQFQRQQEALAKSEERYRAIVENQLECVCRWHPDTTLTYVNEQYCRTFGKTRQELLGSKWIDFVPEDARPAVLEQYRRLAERPEVLTCEHQVVAANGQCRWEQWTDCPILDGQGNVLEFQSVGRDVTEIRQKEEQFRQAQKMEAVGLLAGGIAHDFNNQLTVIKGYCDLLLRSPESARAVAGELEEIRKAASRAAALTSQLLTFSRQQVLRPQVVNLNHVLVGLEGPLSAMVGEAISLTLILGEALGNVRVDLLQLEQAVMNLAVNARDAMPRGGQIVMRTSELDLDQEHARRHAGTLPGPHVMLEITDTGVGMDSAVIGHIFDPFFTTKPVGQGTGLGLSMVYGFVKQSGGHVEVDSRPGEGSTFRIYLPRVHADVSQSAKAASSPAPRGRETVLVAEDSPPVRQLIVRVLGECGYSVLEASGAEEAIPLARLNAQRLTLLVTDVVMPKMSGPELAKVLRQQHAGLRVLFITGYAHDTIIPHGFDAHEHVLTKPFTAERLAQAVRQVLDGPA